MELIVTLLILAALLVVLYKQRSQRKAELEEDQIGSQYPDNGRDDRVGRAEP